MEQDDLIREQFAVGISVREEEGQLELILDDLERVEGSSPARWKQWAYFTCFRLEPEVFEESELSEKQLAAIGRAVVVRLNALRSVAAKPAKTG